MQHVACPSGIALSSGHNERLLQCQETTVRTRFMMRAALPAVPKPTVMAMERAPTVAENTARTQKNSATWLASGWKPIMG